MITRLTVEHFKSIVRIDLALKPISVFVGPNASGKSNVIDAIRFIKDAISYDLDRAVSERHGIDSIRQWSRSRPYHVSISLSAAHLHGYGHLSLTLGSSKGNYRIVREEAQWTDRAWPSDQSQRNSSTEHVNYVRDRDGTVRLEYHRDGRQEGVHAAVFEDRDSLFLSVARLSRFFYRSMPISSLRIMEFSALRRALMSSEAYSIFPNILRTPQKPSNERQLSSGGDNSTSVFKLMQRSKTGGEAKSEIIAALRHIMPNLVSIVIQSVAVLMVPSFRVREPDGKVHDFNVSQISDGTLRVLGLLTALYQPRQPDVIALEEPKQTVNPGVLAVIADAVRDISSRTQVLITTRSPNFVDYFDPEFIYAVEMEAATTRVGSISKFQKDSVKERLLTLGELMTAEGLVAG